MRGFLLRRGGENHMFLRKRLQRSDASRGSYTEIANFAIAHIKINIAAGDKAPEIHLAELLEQANGGSKRYGGILDPHWLKAILVMICPPTTMLNGDPLDYKVFLMDRRRLMAEKIRQWVEML